MEGQIELFASRKNWPFSADFRGVSKPDTAHKMSRNILVLALAIILISVILQQSSGMRTSKGVRPRV